MVSLKELIIEGYAKLDLYRFSGIRERALSAISKQDDETSFMLHNSEYKYTTLEKTRKLYKEFKDENTFDKPTTRFKKLLDQNPQVGGVAVDIGCGSGWLSAELSKRFAKVVGIEPSQPAISMAQRLFPEKEYPNVEWRVGFAEKEIGNITSDKPMAFFTCVVLSHLKDDAVARICDTINNCAPAGSVLGFSECWGEEYHRYMWHVRTQGWWQKHLPGWELDFFGPEIENVKGRHTGFHGVKKK